MIYVWISLYPVLGWLLAIALVVLFLAVAFNFTGAVRKGMLLPGPLRRDLEWRVIGLGAVAVVVIFFLWGLTRWLSTRQLSGRMLSLSSEITSFADERSRSLPPPGEPDWDEYTHLLARFSDETSAIYTERFGPRVAEARDELIRRGIVDDELEHYFQRPKTPVAVRTVGERLEYLAKQLE